jgi:hypothetical protein
MLDNIKTDPIAQQKGVRKFGFVEIMNREPPRDVRFLRGFLLVTSGFFSP